jgi:hypothetical protein
MTRSNRWLATTSLFLVSALVLANGTWGQDSETPCALCFGANPQTQLLKQGEPVILVLSIYNRSAEPIFVSRLKNEEFVDFKIIGPDGKEVPWQGKGRIASREYSASDFAALDGWNEISAKRIISLNDGAGFVFDKPGQYSVTAEYSLKPPEYFAPFAGKTKIHTGSFRYDAAFCIEACIHEPLRVSNNASRSALDAVRVLYTHITKYRPIGIPEGRAKNALWPLLSKRLVQQLDGLQACNDDYFRRYGDVLRSNQYKPAIPWLEEGLFSGPNEAAGPMKFAILDSRAIGENRVDVHLRFMPKELQERYEGVVTLIQENNRWVVDDFVSMYENDELHRLSDGYRECKGGQWMEETPH